MTPWQDSPSYSPLQGPLLFGTPTGSLTFY